MKKRFIDAYIWCYGTTKKRAEEVYKKADNEYIILTIESYENNSKKSFYND